MAYPEYDPNEPSLGQTFADLLRGVKNPKSWQEVGQGIQNVAKVTPSVVESLGRGAGVQLVPTGGDTSELLRQVAPNTMQNIFGNRTQATSEEMLAKLPRMTPDYQGSQSHEMMGGVLSPAMPFLLRAGAEATKGLPIGNMIAYHGTPHEIKGAFDISKVGTGEGAQAYGHGMYFAENPSVGGEYANMFSKSPASTTQLTKLRDSAPLGSAEYKHYDDLIGKNGKGNLYKVDIPDKDIPNMLDWDKPLSQQPKSVQDWLKSPYNAYKTKLLAKDVGGNEPTGSLIYNRLQELMSGGKKSDVFANQANFGALNASKELQESGISGIRYLDEGSRNLTNGEIINTFKTPEGWKTKVRVTGTNGTDANGKPISSFTTSMPFKTAKEAEDWAKTKISSGTSNFVVFDPKEVKILEKNSKPVSRKDIIEEQINKIEPTITVNDRSIPVTLHPIEARQGNKIEYVNTDKFENAFKKDQTSYIGKGGTENAIGKRYENIGNFLKDAKSMNASQADVKSNGTIIFGDGRHRFSFLRDQGLSKIPISMDAESIKNAKKFGYID